MRIGSEQAAAGAGGAPRTTHRVTRRGALGGLSRGAGGAIGLGSLAGIWSLGLAGCGAGAGTGAGSSEGPAQATKAPVTVTYISPTSTERQQTEQELFGDVTKQHPY